MINITIKLNEKANYDIRVPLNIKTSKLVAMLSSAYDFDQPEFPILVNQTNGEEFYMFDALTADKVTSGDILILRS